MRTLRPLAPALLVAMTAMTALIAMTTMTTSPAVASQQRGASSARQGVTEITVDEGTSMSVAVSPDGRTLVIDLQGSLWTVPVTGGAAKRITDEYNDARQPSWSPDGRMLAFISNTDDLR